MKKTRGYKIANKIKEFNLLPYGISVSLLGKTYQNNKNKKGSIWTYLDYWYLGLIDNIALLNYLDSLIISNLRHNRTNYDKIKKNRFNVKTKKEEYSIKAINNFWKKHNKKSKDISLTNKIIKIKQKFTELEEHEKQSL